MSDENGRRVKDCKSGLGEWVRWGIGIVIGGMFIFFALQTSQAVLGARVDRHDVQISVLEKKCDDIAEIKTDIKWIKQAIMEIKK